jgi:two-component system response regulator PilR (NtrC family)
MAEVLLVEDEVNARKILSLGLEIQGHQVTGCASADEAEKIIRTQAFDVVLTDLRMQGRDAGLDVIRFSRQLQPQARVLLLTAYASAETAVSAMKEGAFDYLTKPVSSEELAAAVERALFHSPESASQSGQTSQTVEGAASDHGLLIGHSAPMQRVRERLRRGAKSDFTILITGESGTGKELAARYVHAHSGRARGPFIPVHCSAIPEGLFESELFGHRKGAFTGAELDRTGLIESAESGTLFLDEVGEMPLSTQVKLLRVLQEKRIRPVGADQEHDVDVRVIAATNRDLSAEVQQGHFREDLFFRLNVVPVHMPPLRQRPEDIPLLAHAVVRRWSEGRARLNETCLQRLAELPFMGNVRELENLLQRMLALSDSGDLDIDLLNEVYTGAPANEQLSLALLQEQGGDLDGWMASIEQQLIDEALAKTGGNVTRAAEQLGVSFRSLRYRLKRSDTDGEEG